MNRLVPFLAASMLFAFAACSNEDDVNTIFVGKTWQITSATSDGETLSGDEIKELYTYSGTYCLTFTTSTFTGVLVSGSSVAGRWSADGDTRELRMSFTTARQVDASTVSETIYTILSNATAYAGDQNTLTIKADSHNYVLLSSSATP